MLYFLQQCSVNYTNTILTAIISLKHKLRISGYLKMKHFHCTSTFYKGTIVTDNRRLAVHPEGTLKDPDMIK